MRIVFPDGAGCVQDPSELEPLRKLGDVDFYDGPPPDRATLIGRLQPAEVVVLDYSEMDAEVLRACARLRFISFLGIGYNSCIDVAEATRRGVVVAYTPDYGATSVAEHALAMMLALTRHVGPAFVSVREGRWEPGRFVGMQLRGRRSASSVWGRSAPRWRGSGPASACDCSAGRAARRKSARCTA